MIRPGEYPSVDDYERQLAKDQEAAMQTFGPYNSEREAIEDARDVLDLEPGGGRWTGANTKKLRAACAAAGLELGNYDAWVLAGLAQREPQSVQVIIGLISRAGAK